MQAQCVIRRAVPSDAQAISTLIDSLSRYRSSNAEGPPPEQFSAGYAAARIEADIANCGVSYFIAAVEEAVVGVVGVGGGSRIQHFFVAEALHRQGTGRALWERAKEEVLKGMKAGDERVLEVFSSLHAVPVYERFGFDVAGGVVEGIGFAYVPMRTILRKGGSR